MARHGADFLRAHGMDADGNWYFALDRDGRPLVQPYNIFSDCFAAMAFSRFAAAAGDADAKALALRTYGNVLRRMDNPKGQWSKAVPGSRPLASLAVPMILANLSLEMEDQVIRATLRLTGPHVSKHITFEFSHFMSPNSIYPAAANLYRRYAEEHAPEALA